MLSQRVHTIGIKSHSALTSWLAVLVPTIILRLDAANHCAHMPQLIYRGWCEGTPDPDFRRMDGSLSSQPRMQNSRQG